MNRQKLFLLILVVLLVSAIVYAYLRTPQQKSVERLKYVHGAPAEGKNGETAKVEAKKLNLELLDRPLPRFTGFKRNIFWLAAAETKKKLPPPPPPPSPSTATTTATATAAFSVPCDNGDGKIYIPWLSQERQQEDHFSA